MSNSLSIKLNQSLNSQCFQEFPSGKGSWNLGTDCEEDGNQFTEDELLEFICSKQSPWKTENILSNEVVSIKNEIIRSKFSSTSKFVKKKLCSLRLLGKDIVTVDEGLSTMDNLTELILSANHICCVNAIYLPKKLKVLELYSNEMNSIGFCQEENMPHLEHFGVGANNVVDIKPLTDSVLSTSLVSLDLGRNFLTDLSSTVFVISQLKSIKNLILAGNPLALLAVYRGFVVDSIVSLNCLDDIVVTADEKYSVKKMSKIPDSIKKLCKLKISVPSINNVPAKELSENAPEEPLIKTEFYIKLWFPFQFHSQDSLKNSSKEDITESNLPNLHQTESENDIMYVHKSAGLTCLNQEIPFNWTEDIDIDNVGKFCKFLDEPFRIYVMEETKYLYSPENLPSKSPSRMESQNSKRHAQNKSANKEISKDANKSKKDTGKKKKIDESKMVVYSKKVRKLVEYLVDISHLKDGEIVLDQLLTSNIDCQRDKIDFDNKSKKLLDSKVKKTSAKDRLKSIEKSNTTKATKTLSVENDDREPNRPVECHLILNLLSIKNVKLIDNC